MVIPTLESLILRDFVQYPAAILTRELIEDTTDLEHMLTFDLNSSLFQVINQWTTIRQLEIYGIDDSNDELSPWIALSNYLNSLRELTTLVLYGIGAATSLAYTLFRHDQMMLPRLSHFLLAVTQMSSLDNDNLSRYLISRQRHQLPRLEKLSINLGYIQHLTKEDCIDILRESSEDIFIIPDPEIGKFIPFEEVNLLEIVLPRP